MNKILAFEKMLTPIIIQAIFWIGSLACVIIGVLNLAAATDAAPGDGALKLIGVLWILIGPIVVRVYCEFIIVVFLIHSTLVEIKSNTSEKNRL